MASPSVASRSRRVAADPDDAAIARAIAFSAWARKNARRIMIVAGVVLAAAAVLLYMRYLAANKAEAASRRFLEIQQTVETGNPAAAEKELQTFVTAYDGTVEADEARLALAEIHLRANAPKKAVPLAQAVAEGDSPLSIQGSLLLAAAHAAAGDRAAAVRTYEAAAEEATLRYQKLEALTGAAMLHEQANDFTAAAAIYKRTIELTEEGSMDRSVMEMRLAEAQARAGARR